MLPTRFLALILDPHDSHRLLSIIPLRAEDTLSAAAEAGQLSIGPAAIARVRPHWHASR